MVINIETIIIFYPIIEGSCSIMNTFGFFKIFL